MIEKARNQSRSYKSASDMKRYALKLSGLNDAVVSPKGVGVQSLRIQEGRVSKGIGVMG